MGAPRIFPSIAQRRSAGAADGSTPRIRPMSMRASLFRRGASADCDCSAERASGPRNVGSPSKLKRLLVVGASAAELSMDAVAAATAMTTDWFSSLVGSPASSGGTMAVAAAAAAAAAEAVLATAVIAALLHALEADAMCNDCGKSRRHRSMSASSSLMSLSQPQSCDSPSTGSATDAAFAVFAQPPPTHACARPMASSTPKRPNWARARSCCQRIAC
mmetsp:Transcript_90172/g.254332  ORF Transcript_90172/g.254332 Transcript_90172/m.254332 type:complete len:218 (+) Transcript_90172:368-1021(+)